jgi:ATP-dependent helicase/nuclease subunit A
MSIHKSKGLEFPVCIIAGCAKQFNKEDIRRHALFNPLYGFGSKLRDEKLKFKYTTLPREIVSLETEKSALSEEMRVLYVAMTRAKEKLIAVATLSNAQSTIKKAALLIDSETKKITPFNAMQSSGFAEWIIACAMRHPSCTSLRQLSGLGENIVIDDAFKWILRYEEAQDSGQTEITAETQAEQTTQYDCELAKLINNRLAFCYPYKALSTIPTKISVSELAVEHSSKAHGKSSAEAIRPSFLREQSLTGAEAGTALHGFMQYANLLTLKSISDIDCEIERLVQNQFLLPEQGEAINKYKVIIFLQSQINKRICKAQKIYKEFKFNIELPVNEIYKEHLSFEQEKIIIQGMADMVFCEDDRYFVLDYKTDYVQTEQELIEKYKNQLDIYARAVGEIMGSEVQGKYIYSFCLEKNISLN